MKKIWRRLFDWARFGFTSFGSLETWSAVIYFGGYKTVANLAPAVERQARAVGVEILGPYAVLKPRRVYTLVVKILGTERWMGCGNCVERYRARQRAGEAR